MARPMAANWIAEYTSTTGTGDITLAGTLEGFAPFSVMTPGLIYYTLQDELDKECGIGTLVNGKIQRTTVFASFVNGTYASPGQKLDLSGYAEVYCTVNADLFNSMNVALDKLDTIETGATADQNAAEVPSTFPPGWLFYETNVQAAINTLIKRSVQFSAAAAFNVAPNNMGIMVADQPFTATDFFVYPNDMSCYRSDAVRNSGVFKSVTFQGDVATIVCDTQTFTAKKVFMASQDWVAGLQSKITVVTPSSQIAIVNADLGLTFDITLVDATTSIALSLSTEVANTTHETNIIVRQGTGANKVQWPGNIQWADGSPPVLSFAKDTFDYFSFVKIAGNANWIGSTIGGGYGQQA